MENEINFEEYQKLFENDNRDSEVGELVVNYTDRPLLSANLKPLIERAIKEVESFKICTQPDHDDYLELLIVQDTKKETPFEDRIFEIRVYQDGFLTGAREFWADRLDESIEFTDGDLQ